MCAFLFSDPIHFVGAKAFKTVPSPRWWLIKLIWIMAFFNGWSQAHDNVKESGCGNSHVQPVSYCGGPQVHFLIVAIIPIRPFKCYCCVVWATNNRKHLVLLAWRSISHRFTSIQLLWPVRSQLLLQWLCLCVWSTCVHSCLVYLMMSIGT